VFSVFNRWGDRGDIRTLRQFVPTSNSEDLLQVLHIRWVGRTLLLIARQYRCGGLGTTSAARVAAGGKHSKGERRGAADCEVPSRDKHGAPFLSSGRKSLPGST
jgi:hypothetical protein